MKIDKSKRIVCRKENCKEDKWDRIIIIPDKSKPIIV